MRMLTDSTSTCGEKQNDDKIMLCINPKMAVISISKIVNKLKLYHVFPKQTMGISNSSSSSVFRADDIVIQLTTEPQDKPSLNGLYSGEVFSDHMFSVEWTQEDNWKTPYITPLKDLTFHPGAKVLHYGSSCFDGVKACRGYDGKIRFFRPEEHLLRFARSAERTGLAGFDPQELLKCIRKLVQIDQEWVPMSAPKRETSLYIRPVYSATQPTLGVDLSNTAILYVVTAPYGPNSKARGGHLQPDQTISLLVDTQYARTSPGGVGAFNMASNYAPAVRLLKYIRGEGCDQMLWLHGEDQELTQAGHLNLFVYLINEDGEHELVTPPLTSGLVLPGITRQSVLELVRDWDEFDVSERVMTLEELIKAFNERRVLEMFGTETRETIALIRGIKYKNKWYSVDNKFKLAQKIYRCILDIQHGKTESDWVMELK